MLIGEMLIQKGLITKAQLEQALKVQKQNDQDKKLGEILIDLGFLTIEDFQEILHLQIEALNLTD